jgi:nucleoside-diphosphate-sugar epimerase
MRRGEIASVREGLRRTFPAKRLVPTVIASLRSGRPVQITHAQKRDFIYTTDAADLFVRLLLSPENGAFIIATRHATTIRFVVQYIAARCAKTELLHFGAIAPSPGELPFLVANMNKVYDRLSWSAPLEIRSALEQILSSLD